MHKASAPLMKATSSVETGQQVSNLISDWAKWGAETRGGPGRRAGSPIILDKAESQRASPRSWLLSRPLSGANDVCLGGSQLGVCEELPSSPCGQSRDTAGEKG